MLRLLAVVVTTFALTFAGAALADYPERTIRLVVPVTPGGAPDISARLIAERLGEALGKPVVVENRAGANGNIGADLVAKSPADGYTLLHAMDSLIVVNPSLYPEMSFNPLKDLTPVASTCSNTYVLSVHPSLPARTFEEFIEYARKSQRPIPYASGGHGSQHQLGMEMLKQRAGLNLIHVPYKGGTPATTATVAGETLAMFSGASSAPQIKAGRLRGLAVTGASRAEIFPELPTVAQFFPGYELRIWLGIFAPAGTAAQVVARLNTEVNRILADPVVKQKLQAAGGLSPLIGSLEQFQAIIRSDAEKYGKLIRELGIKAE